MQLTVAIEIAHGQTSGTLDLDALVRDRKTALLVEPQIRSQRDDLRIDQDQGGRWIVLLGRVDDDQPARHSNLDGGKTDARRGIHRVQHDVRQLAELSVDPLDLCTPLAQQRVGQGDDWERRHVAHIGRRTIRVNRKGLRRGAQLASAEARANWALACTGRSARSGPKRVMPMRARAEAAKSAGIKSWCAARPARRVQRPITPGALANSPTATPAAFSELGSTMVHTAYSGHVGALGVCPAKANLANRGEAMSWICRMQSPQTPFILGWEEWVALPELRLPAIKAKVDTGARTSALHAYFVEPCGTSRKPMVRFGVHPIPRRSDVEVVCTASVVDRRHVASSNGERENRYVISTLLSIGSRQWPIEVTLTNRDTMSYRMLLGRQAIAEGILVDPASSFRQPRLRYALYTPQER